MTHFFLQYIDTHETIIGARWKKKKVKNIAFFWKNFMHFFGFVYCISINDMPFKWTFRNRNQFSSTLKTTALCETPSSPVAVKPFSDIKHRNCVHFSLIFCINSNLTKLLLDPNDRISNLKEDALDTNKQIACSHDNNYDNIKIRDLKWEITFWNGSSRNIDPHNSHVSTWNIANRSYFTLMHSISYFFSIQINW